MMIDRSKFQGREPANEGVEDQTRTPREADTRETDMAPQDWKPSGALPEPAPSAGWVFRWIRTASLGSIDNRNVSSRWREGWVAVNPQEHPEIAYMVDRNAVFKDNIEIGGLVLCKCPKKVMDQRRAHYAKLANAQLDAVNNSYMSENDPRVRKGVFENTTRVSRSPRG